MIILNLQEIMLSSPIDEIKNRLDVVEVIQSYIKLQKAGASYRALCPFHSEKKPSFFVSPARQIWHCFGSCSEGGDIFKFVMKIEGVEFGDALRILAQKAGVELRKQSPELKTARRRFYEICELASRFFEKQLENNSGGKEAKKYLLSRGMKEESIKKWRLGYAPDTWRGLSDFLVGKGYKREEIAKAGLALKSEKGGDYYDRFRRRIIFPVFNLSSQPIGFGGRIFKERERPDGQEEAKYVNTPSTLLYDKSNILYGLNKAGMAIRKKDSCILVEGYIDEIMVNQAGFENVVATSGTALTSYQLKILKRYSENLLTAFDMDIAGDSATKRGIDLAQVSGFNIRVITMPKDSDPAAVIFKDPKIWENLVEKAKTIHDFYFETTLSKFDKNTLEDKKGISKTLLPIIKKIPNKIEQTYWIQDLAGILNVKEENVLEELQKLTFQNLGQSGQEADQADKEITTPLRQKSRKELLEEHLIALTIKFPQILNLIAEQDLKLFSPQFSLIINNFKNEGFVLKNDFPKELTDIINPLFLKAEVMEIEPGFNSEKEFKYCLKEIKAIEIKNKLDEISQEIKRAEEEKDFNKIQKLMEEFNLYSKSRSELETA